MWETYEFRGHRVVVIQQWTDPYGQRMIRVRLAEAGEDDAVGLSEERFLQDAVAVPSGRI